jgi:hypothetical protein
MKGKSCQVMFSTAITVMQKKTLQCK